MRLWPLALCALAIALGGCGGQSKQDSYRKDFEPLNRSLVQLGKDIGRGLQSAPGKSDRRLGREFAGYAGRLGALRRRIAALDPPDKLRGDQRALVRTVGRVDASLRGIELAAAHHDAGVAQRSTAALVLSSIGLKRAREHLVRDLGKG